MGTGAKISSFTTVPSGSTANKMAEKLYTDSFRDQIVKLTEATLGGGGAAFETGSLSAAAVAIKPERFIPLHPTTTATTTSTLEVTSTTTFTTTTITVHEHVSSEMPTTTVAADFLATTGKVESSAHRQHVRGALSLTVIFLAQACVAFMA